MYKALVASKILRISGDDMGRQRTRIGTNGTQPKPFEEVGTPGLEIYSGYIAKAYNTKLHWPGVEPLYSRIWRSDPEVATVRTLLDAWASGLSVTVDLPDKQGGIDLGEPSDDDRRAQEFGYQVLDDISGGIKKWLTAVTTRTPFFGFGIWEVVSGLRQPTWKPPNEGDDWRSEYDDGLVGIRRLAFRDYSSFESWEADDNTGRVMGVWQNDPPNERRLLESDRLLHIIYGDLDNPEGLATLEAMWRLERIKYGHEVTFGIGAEHTAGHLSVKAEKKLTTDDLGHIKRAARAILTAQEGNYAAWPEGFNGEIIDVPFAAAPSLLEAIRYYSILKLSLLGMQWIAQSGISSTGTYGAMQDSSNMAVLLFNSMIGGFEQQFNEQVMKRLYAHPVNAAAFPNMTRRPQLKISRLDKLIELEQMGNFLTALNAIMPLGDEDYVAIRRKSEFLPETLPEPEQTAVPETMPEDSDAEPDTQTPEDEAAVAAVEDEDSEMSTQRWWELRAEIYRTKRGDTAELVDMLDNATTNAGLARVEELLNG